MKNKALIIGSGLCGSSCAYSLAKEGWDVTVFEKEYRVGGHVKTATLGGLMYEEYAIHINHTDSDEVIDLIKEVSDWKEYSHIVKTVVDGVILSWPPQIDEISKLPYWEKIKEELTNLPETPDTTNFETYAISIMGKTLYEKFIYGYTKKHWGTDPKNLSSSFAPKRIDLRNDNNLYLFKDKWQAFPKEGWSNVIDKMLTTYPIKIWLGKNVTHEDIDWNDFDAVVVTAPLDEFLNKERLPWKGVRVEHEYVPNVENTLLPAAQVNFPDIKTLYNRKTETKWYSGENTLGTIVTYEYPGAPYKHYPVDDANGFNRQKANGFKTELKEKYKNAIIAGRLANYVYINTDQAILQGINAAKKAISRSKK